MTFEEMDIDLFSDLMPEPPMQISLPRRISRKLRALGIRNFVIIDYDESFGPYVRFFWSKRSRIYSEIDKNPAFLSDIMILSKDTKELLLKDERTLLIFEPLDEKGLKILIIETTREFRDNAYELLNKLISRIDANNLDINQIKEAVERIIGDEQ